MAKMADPVLKQHPDDDSPEQREQSMSSRISPAEPLPTRNDPSFESLTDDFERTFFEGDEQIHVRVTLMRETWDAIQQYIEANQWKINDGPIILLTTGMTYLRAERALDVTQGVDDLSKEDVKKLLERLAVIEARYASIKNFAFSIMRDHRTLEMRFTPLEIEHRAFKAMLWPLREENEALKQEVARLQAALAAQPVGQNVPPPAAPSAPLPWWRRALQRLTGRR